MAVIDGKIRCNVCKESKPVENFQPAIVKKGCGECRPCKYLRKRKYEKSNPERFNAQVRARRLRRNPEELKQINRKSRAKLIALDKDYQRKLNLKRYGLTIEQYDQILKEQGGGCAICRAKENGVGRLLYVDHCHGSGRVRGILCHNCNSGIGHFKDDPALMLKAIQYIERG